MWHLAGHDEDLGFFQKWEGKPLEGVGTEVKSRGWGARMSGLESCLCIASLIECRESRCLPCKIIVRIQLILAKSLCLVGSKCYINISLLIWMALGRAVTEWLPRVQGRSRKRKKVAQSCPTLCKPMDYTVHGILQARILEWVAYPFSSGCSRPRNQTRVSCIVGRFFTSWATREAQECGSG